MPVIILHFNKVKKQTYIIRLKLWIMNCIVITGNLTPCLYYSLRETNFDVLSYELSELRQLDISCETGHQLEAFLNEEVSPLPVEKLLTTPDCLPNILSLDISGREIATTRHVRSVLNPLVNPPPLPISQCLYTVLYSGFNFLTWHRIGESMSMNFKFLSFLSFKRG